MRQNLLVLLAAGVFCAAPADAQRTVWAGAASGLSLREKPSSGSALLRKIPLGERLTAFDGGEAITVEGFVTFWTRVRTATDSGYVVDAFLLPVRPPAKGLESLKDWAESMGQPACVPAATDAAGIKRTMRVFPNGAILTVTEGYAYYAEMLLLPDVSVEEAFLLIRGLLVPGNVLPSKSALPREPGREQADATEKTWRVSYHPGDESYLHWAERLSFERHAANEATEIVEIVNLEDGVAISYSTGS